MAFEVAQKTVLSAPPASASRGFVDLDERICSQVSSIALVCVPTTEDAMAIASHLARRASAHGAAIVVTQDAPLWSEVAARLGIGRLPCEPLACAERLAEALVARRATVIAAAPAEGSWDALVAHELVRLPTTPWIYFTTTSTGSEFAGSDKTQRFEVGAIFGEEERRRWFDALAAVASASFDRDLKELEGWWRAARGARSAPVTLAPEETRKLVMIEAIGRAVRRASLPFDVSALEAAGAIVREGEWIRPQGTSEPGAVDPSVARDVARVLAQFEGDPWASLRAAELFLAANDPEAADAAHDRALSLADDGVVRHEITQRWMRAVDSLPAGEARAKLQARAAARALRSGDAEAAFHWSGAAAAVLFDPRVTLLHGRAASAFGDLSTSRRVLESNLASAPDDVVAEYEAELAEVEYRSAHFELAERHARASLARSPNARTRLSARNTLGKLLLARSEWALAERHFAEDGAVAIAADERTSELRARVNRGIAVLHGGNIEEAQAIFESVREEGERHGEDAACAFALDNLVVTAMWRHDYGAALELAERTFLVRRRLGDRLTTVATIANVAELRRQLGLFDHARHAVAFGRRAVSPGMPKTFAIRLAVLAGMLAFDRGNTAEAQREVSRALVDAEVLGHEHFLDVAHHLAARVAIEDGDLDRARFHLDHAARFDEKNEHADSARAESAILRAKLARAAGELCDREASSALQLARLANEEALIREAHVLLAEVHRASGDVISARRHARQAALVRDQVAFGLTGEVRAAFLARPDVLAIERLEAQLAPEPEAPSSRPPETTRSTPAARSAVGRESSRELVGDDPSIRGLNIAIRKVARTDSTILIRGESGTGKELVAEAVHRASDRAGGPFVAVNCAALVETLLLSELFGHEKGAFTGAAARRRGRFELAEQGTLFLDEIGDISPRTQVALLRVLQEKTFERVGGTSPIRANVRVICATHRDLRAMVDRGEFREDLYYRLRGITLEIPPLRSRVGDIPRIAAHLLERIAGERGEATKQLSSDALDLLERHRWPGNVRELENALRAAALFAEGDVIQGADLVDNVDDLKSLRAPPPSPSSRDLEDEETVTLPPTEAGPTAVAYACLRQGAVSLGELKRQIERDCIARALAETRGNITRAAALLGMKRPRLSQLVKQYGLSAVSIDD